MTDDTAKFVLDYILGKSINNSWKDWAYSNYMKGYEFESLMSLIVLDYPANQFEAKDIVISAFSDLDIDISDIDFWVCKYVNNIEKSMEYNSIKEILKKLFPLYELYLQSNFEFRSIQEFYLLYNGISDLEDSGMQWYHENLNMNNIEETVRLAFLKFQKGYCKL